MSNELEGEPESLYGIDLLRHEKKLLDALEKGQKLQVWVSGRWFDATTPEFNSPLHYYRLKTESRNPTS